MLLDVRIKGSICHLVTAEPMLPGQATVESHEPVDKSFEASRSLQEGSDDVGHYNYFLLTWVLPIKFSTRDGIGEKVHISLRVGVPFLGAQYGWRRPP